MYEKLKKEKAQEIVMLLDLFEGKITLNEILTTDIALINQLRDAKLEIKKMETIERMSKQNRVQLMNPSEIKKGT